MSVFEKKIHAILTEKGRIEKEEKKAAQPAFDSSEKARERAAFAIGKARAYLTVAVEAIATLAAFYNADKATCEMIGAALSDAFGAVETLAIPATLGAPVLAVKARVRVREGAYVRTFLTNPDAMRTVMHIEGGIATLTGNVKVSCDDLEVVK